MNKYSNIKLSNESFLTDFCGNYSITFQRLIGALIFQGEVMEIFQNSQSDFRRQFQICCRFS